MYEEGFICLQKVSLICLSCNKIEYTVAIGGARLLVQAKAAGQTVAGPSSARVEGASWCVVRLDFHQWIMDVLRWLSLLGWN